MILVCVMEQFRELNKIVLQNYGRKYFSKYLLVKIFTFSFHLFRLRKGCRKSESNEVALK